MSKVALSSKENALMTVTRLIEMSKLDTVFKDLYFQRARTWLASTLTKASYEQLKENTAQIPWVEQQLRAAVERAEWKKSGELTARLRDLKASVDGADQSIKLGETVYEAPGTVSFDPFSTGLNVFTGSSNESLPQRRADAINLLVELQRSDPDNKDFYARRLVDFKTLSIATTVTNEGGSDEKSKVDPAELQLAALNSLESGDLSRLEQLIETFSKKPVETNEEKSSPEAEELGKTVELGDDLDFSFSEQTLVAARELGLSPRRTRSRRNFAYLVPHGWQPSFRKDEVRKWSKDKLTRLTYPSTTTDKAREAIEFYLLNPFISSGGSRYKVCLVEEDLLLEDFPEPENKEEVPSKLLSKLGFYSRWGLSRIDIENALVNHGSTILNELQLNPELFQLVVVPPDIYTHLGEELGWGQKEMWTHFDGYRVLEGGKLQALAGGDKRFGGTHDVVSFNPGYTSTKIFARFAVVQRKRMMDWQKG